MLRGLAVLAVLALTCGAEVRAAEVIGKIKSVDADNKQITLVIDGKDKTFSVADGVKVTTMSGKAKKPVFTPIAGGLKGLTAGAEVSCLTTPESGDKFVEIRVQNLKKRKKDK